jgi:predicted Zn-dependent protease
MVALDAPQLTEVMARDAGGEQVRAILMHELGHLVGLDHVDDPGELMYAESVGTLGFGAGDREGLASLGSGRCFH